MLNEHELKFLDRAAELSLQGMSSGNGGPFGCVIVLNNQIVGEGYNMVTSTNDPTAHAEVVAIRNACANLKAFQLNGCDVYTSCEPCPMCLGALYWARVNRVIYANTRQEAAAIEFDDEFIYNEINTDFMQRAIPFIHVPHAGAKEVFEKWRYMDSKLKY
ncbi:MAG TPA: nucleoside deaminase [Chitinophagaceae bacterium]|nr:nucleoside deaminase [Chitinophagaceae bacterium]